MAFDILSLFNKNKKTSDVDALFKELGIDDATLDEENDKKKEKIDKLIKTITKHKAIASMGYIFLGIGVLVGIGGFLVLSTSINQHDAVLQANLNIMTELKQEIEVAKKEIESEQAQIDILKNKEEIIGAILDNRVLSEKILDELDSIIEDLSEEETYIFLSGFTIAPDNTITIQGNTSEYTDYAKLIEALEKSNFKNIQFTGANKSNEENNVEKIPINLSFIYDAPRISDTESL